MSIDLPFGTPSSLPRPRAYPYEGKGREIDDLLRRHGFKVEYGGTEAKPGQVNVPLAKPGSDFSSHQQNDGWSKMHGLAEALIKPQVDEIHGPDASPQKTVHSTYLATHKQRQLSHELGIEIPDEHFHQELNANMRDSIHKALGRPPHQNLEPHSHHVPLSVVMDTLRSNLANVQKKEPVIFEKSGSTRMSDKTYTSEEAATLMLKHTADKIKSMEAEIASLRKREVEKALIPSHKHNKGSDVGAGVEDVPAASVNPPGKNDPFKGKGAVAKEESSCEDSSHEGSEESSGEVSAMDKAELCKACGKSHGLEKGCLGKSEKFVIPKSKVHHPEGSGGQMKKGKSLASLRKTAMEASRNFGANSMMLSEPKLGKAAVSPVPTAKPPPKASPKVSAPPAPPAGKPSMASAAPKPPVAKGVIEIVAHNKEADQPSKDAEYTARNTKQGAVYTIKDGKKDGKKDAKETKKAEMLDKSTFVGKDGRKMQYGAPQNAEEQQGLPTPEQAQNQVMSVPNVGYSGPSKTLNPARKVSVPGSPSVPPGLTPKKETGASRPSAIAAKRAASLPKIDAAIPEPIEGSNSGTRHVAALRSRAMSNKP